MEHKQAQQEFVPPPPPPSPSSCVPCAAVYPSHCMSEPSIGCAHRPTFGFVGAILTVQLNEWKRVVWQMQKETSATPHAHFNAFFPADVCVMADAEEN